MGSSRGLSTKESQILEDFRAKQAQRAAKAVTNSGFDPRERLRLAREQQKRTDSARAESNSRASQAIAEAQNKARQAKATAQRIAQQKKSQADKGFVQTTTGSGRSVSVSQDTATRLAERIRQSERQKAEREAQQRNAQAQKVSRPITTPSSISDFANKFTQPQTQIKRGKQPDLSKVSPLLRPTQSSKSVSKGRSSQFGQQVERGSIGQTVRNLPPANIRPLTDEQKRTPQFLDGQVKQFLTEDQKPKDRSSLSFLPSIPQAHAEEFPEQQNFPRQEGFQGNVEGVKVRQPTPAPIRTIKAGEEFRFVTLNPTAGREISRETLPDGSESVTREGAIRVTEGVKGSDAILQERPPVSSNFIEGFLLGGQQEVANFGNVLDVVTGQEGTTGIKSRKEVGSTVVDIPFSVGGALLTKERPEGEGFFGLGFDFDVSDKSIGRAQQAFGEEGKFIQDEFARDPARALGSTVTALGIEIGLLVGTGGAGNVARKGIVKGAKFVAKTKQDKAVRKLAKEFTPAGEEDIPILIEKLGSGKYVIARGTDELAGLGAKVISPSEAVITQITRAGKVLTTNVPLLRVGGKGSKIIKHKESDIQAVMKNPKFQPNPKNPKSARDQAIDQLNTAVKSKVKRGESSQPVTVIEFTGKKGNEVKHIDFFNKRIPKDKGNLDLKEATITGVTDSTRFLSKDVQKKTGLRLVELATKKQPKEKFFPRQAQKVRNVKEKFKRKQEIDKFKEVLKRSEESTTVSGRPTAETINLLKEGEKLGFFQLGARAIRVQGEDIIKNPALVKQYVKTQRTLTGRQSQLGSARVGSIAGEGGIEQAEKRLAQQLANTSRGERKVKIPRKRSDTQPLNVQTVDFFQAQALGRQGGKEVVDIFGRGVRTGKNTPLGEALADTAKGGAKKSGKGADDIGKSNKGTGGQSAIFDDGLKGTVKTGRTQSPTSIREAVSQEFRFGGRQGVKKGTKPRIPNVFDDVTRATTIGARGIGIQQGLVVEQQPKIKDKVEDRLITNVIPIIDTEDLLKQDDDRDNFPIFIQPIKTKTKPQEDTKLGTGIIPVQVTSQIVDQVPDQSFDNTPTIITTTTPTIPIPFGAPPSSRNEALRRAKEARGRKPSKKGNRLFDVADTPFGEVTVGLGFFVEQKGDESIAEAIGIPDKKKTKKNQPSVDSMFDPSGLFGG